MLNLSLKQAETAFAKGQLDEAFSLVRSESARATRQAQELVARLVVALVSRGNDHLAGGRLTAAASDAAKAVELGGQQAEVAVLFESVQRAKASRSKQQRHDDELLRQARLQIERGVGSVGKQILQRANPDQTDVKQLAEQLDVRRELNDAAIRRARAAIDAGQFDLAMDVLIQLLKTQPDHPQVGNELARVVVPVVDLLHEDLRSGRLDRVSNWQKRLESVAEHSTKARELVDVIERCQRLRRYLDRSSYQQADRELGLLSQVIPGAGWIENSRATLQDVISALTQLHSGPLGLMGTLSEGKPSSSQAVNATAKIPSDFGGQEETTLTSLPSRLLLQIDGVGSVLMLTRPAIRIGSASRSNAIDIPLLSDGIDGSLEIRREGDDYLLSAPSPVDVNGRKLSSRLLNSGDVISFGRRGRVRFVKPIAASSTAILELTGAPMQRSDIRRVALFADSLILGKESVSQLAIRGQDCRYLLYRSGHLLVIRGTASGSNGIPAGPSVPIRLGESVVLDDVRLRITDFDAASSPGHPSQMRSRYPS